MEIHPTAIVDPRAELADNVTVRAYSVIGPHVNIGEGTRIGPHAIIDGWTSIGRNNEIYPYTTVGYPPQDTKYRGGETRVEIGDNNVIRENVTIHRGTELGGGITRIGDNNLIMAYVHVAHDCLIGNRVVMANVATLGGHVQIDDGAVVGGLSAVHQFVRIGLQAYIGGKSGISRDVPPYMLVRGFPAKLYGPNMVGLKRQGMASENIMALKRAYRTIFRSNLTFDKALREVEEQIDPMPPEVKVFVDFLKGSKRGFTR